MISIKNLSLKKKIAALFLAAVSVIVPAMSFCIASNNAHAATEGNLSIGDKIAQDTRATVIKNTICVKRWHEYVFTLYYLGTFDNVFVAEVRMPKFITSYYEYSYTKEIQKISSYNLTTTLSDKITAELEIEGEIGLSGFLNNAKSFVNVSSSNKIESAVTVSETITYTESVITEEKIFLKVDGVNSPYNHYYGDMLMMARANKFRLHVYKQQHAKYRKSALHKWSEYQIEETWDQDYIFYASYYNSSANFYRLTGDLGNHDQYLNLISNAGK